MADFALDPPPKVGLWRARLPCSRRRKARTKNGAGRPARLIRGSGCAKVLARFEVRGGTVPTAVAVVTGASRGIGKQLAVDLARAGYDVVCAARSTESAPSRLPGSVDATADLVRQVGRRGLAVALDVRDEKAVAELAERVLGELGRCDLLINNAAVAAPLPALQDTTTPLAAWRRRQSERAILHDVLLLSAHASGRRPGDQHILGRGGDSSVRPSELHRHQTRTRRPNGRAGLRAARTDSGELGASRPASVERGIRRHASRRCRSPIRGPGDHVRRDSLARAPTDRIHAGTCSTSPTSGSVAW